MYVIRDKLKYRAKVRTKSQSENTGFTDGLQFKLGYFSIEIKRQKWNKCCIHLGIWQYKNYGGLAYLDPNNPLDQVTIDKLREKFKDWKGDKNEPFWKYFDNEYKDYYNLESWKKIEKGKFEKYIEGFIKEIYEKIKDVEL